MIFAAIAIFSNTLMKNILILTTVLASNLIASCGHGQQIHQSDALLINVKESNDLFQSFPDTVHVELEASADGKIPGMITKLAIYNDTLFILDAYKSKAIYAYDLQGNSLFVYDKFGEGPGEYLLLTDMWVTPKFLYILDSSRKNVLKLTHNGKFVSDDNIPHRVNHIKPIEDAKGKNIAHFLDMSNYAEPRLLHYRKGRSDTLMYTPEGMSNFSYSAMNVFASEGDTTLYMPCYSSIIYKLDKNGHPCKYMALDFNGLMPDGDFFKTLKGMKSNDKFERTKDGYAYYFDFCANTSNIMISFCFENDSYCSFIDRKTSQVRVYRLNSNYTPLYMNDEVLYLRDNDDSVIIMVSLAD